MRNPLQEDGSVADFYAGKTVFITGATGFLGGILVEKLLRSCPEIKKVLLLIRKKRDARDVQGRLKTLISSPLFSKLDGDILQKVEAVEGDISCPGLQLTTASSHMLIRDVDVVFHVAACINFNATLDKAINNNLEGTFTLLKLAKKMINLKAFVYVSTAYCNCTQRDIVAEKVYPSRWDPKSIIEMANNLSPEELRSQTQSFLGGHPNTYSFTKHLTENLLLNERGDVPLAIVRPSIVLGTMRDPIPGWVENVNNGAFAFIAGSGRGVFRTLLSDGSKLADLVPSDLLASLLVVSARQIAKTKNLEVYHYTSGSDNPITWGEYINHSISAIRKYPCSGLIMYPRAKPRASKLRNKIFHFWAHYLPACFIDLLFWISGDKRRILEIQNKYNRGQDHSAYFTCNEWIFSKSNTEQLLKELTEEDRKEFDFDVSQVNWTDYIESCARGIRRFYHGETERNLSSARKELAIWRVIDAAFTTSIFMIFLIVSGLLTENLLLAIIFAVLLTSLYIWF